MKKNGLLIAIIAVLALVVVKFAFFGGYDAKSVARLMNKSFSKKNYSATITINNEEYKSANIDCKLKRKNDVYLYEMSYGSGLALFDGQSLDIKVYMDVSNDDVVMTMLGMAFVGHASDLDEEYSAEKMDKSSDIIKILKDKDIKFEFLGIEKYDSKQCVHFEITKKDGTAISDSTYKEELYVDKSTGSMERLIAYDKDGKVELDSDFEFEFNVVKDADVEKPSTAGMSVMNLKDMKK